MSALLKAQVVDTAYEHVKGIYGEGLENSEAFDSEEILRIPSVGRTALLFSSGSETQHLATYDGFSMYACQMSHTSKGGL